MKKIYFVFVAFFTIFISNAQIINFPDANFKAKLLSASTSNSIAKNAAGTSIKIDANNNGQIEQSEALLVHKLFVRLRSRADRLGVCAGAVYRHDGP